MKQFQLAGLVFLVMVTFFFISPCLASSVQDQVQVSIDHILQILKDPSLKGEASARERRASLRRVIYEKFNFERMSQLSLGRHWRDRTDDEKKEFIDLFGKLLEETYVSKIEGYRNEKIAFVKEFVQDKKAQVNTKVITENIEIPIDYRLYLEEDGLWRVYDVVIEGVSLVGNYRSQFEQVLQRSSYEKLLEDLKKKTGQ